MPAAISRWGFDELGSWAGGVHPTAQRFGLWYNFDDPTRRLPTTPLPAPAIPAAISRWVRASTWKGAVSDGTTLWFINTKAPPTPPFAYNAAATRARDTGRDILLGTGSTGKAACIRRHHLWFVNTRHTTTLPRVAYNASDPRHVYPRYRRRLVYR